MDLNFSEKQQLLRKNARDFFTKNYTSSVIREIEKDEAGYSDKIWKAMADFGWMGLFVPEKYNGCGCDFLDLVVLLEEMERCCLQSPFIPTVVCSGLPIQNFGTVEQKDEFLPAIAAGQLIMSIAHIEANARYDESGIEVTAREENEQWIIEGTKLFVNYAHVAQWLICVARAPQGITLFLIDTKSPGLSVTVLDTLSNDKLCEVSFDKVTVPKNRVLGEIGKGWQIVEKISEWGTLAQCALISGLTQKVLEITTEYAKERVQFDRPIGSFQVIQHKCVDMLADTESVKFLTYHLAWMMNEGMPINREISMAKARASDAARRVCLAGQAIHGGIGISSEHDMQIYFRQAKALELAFGDADFHREVLAEKLGF